MSRTWLDSAAGFSYEVPMPTGTFAVPHLAVSKAKILLRVLEERLYSLSVRVRPNHVGRWRVDLVRSEVLHRILFVLVVCDFLRDE
jgi:hypothetical protein